MTYISSNDARQQDSTGEVEGFSTPSQEMFRCTCHGKRWPLSYLRMENNGQRHCPNQARSQGGSVDRDVLRDYDRVELERRAVEDATPVQWPISPLENVACVAAIVPAQQILHLGGPNVVVVVQGVNLTASDTVVVASSDASWPPAGLDTPTVVVVVAGDGLSVTVTVTPPLRTYIPPLPLPHFPVDTPRTNLDLTYNGVVYESVLLLR